MNIGPTDGVPSPGRVERSRIGKVPPPAPSASPASGADRVEISETARLLAELMNVPAVREDRVADVRSQIESGEYDTPERLQAAIERFLTDNSDLV